MLGYLEAKLLLQRKQYNSYILITYMILTFRLGSKNLKAQCWAGVRSRPIGAHSHADGVGRHEGPMFQPKSRWKCDVGMDEVVGIPEKGRDSDLFEDEGRPPERAPDHSGRAPIRHAAGPEAKPVHRIPSLTWSGICRSHTVFNLQIPGHGRNEDNIGFFIEDNTRRNL